MAYDFYIYLTLLIANSCCKQVVYILCGYREWLSSTSSGGIRMGYEYPRPLDRTQEGVIMKFFAAHVEGPEIYNYAQIRADTLDLYKVVSNVYSNLYFKFDPILYHSACILYRQQFSTSTTFLRRPPPTAT